MSKLLLLGGGVALIGAGVYASQKYATIIRLLQKGNLKLDGSEQLKKDLPTVYVLLRQKNILPKVIPVKVIYDIITGTGQKKKNSMSKLQSLLKYFQLTVE